MSHRMALYRVQVRPKRNRDEWRLFGDYDKAGTWLGDIVTKALTTFAGRSSDGKVAARFEASLSNLKNGQVGAALVSGRSGITSVIERQDDPPFQRMNDHVEAMRSAVVFDLPRGQNVGQLAVHVPDGRSCKGILDSVLRATMAPLGYMIELSPIVPANALQEAVDRGALERVTLIKHDPVHDDKFAAAAQWGSDNVGKVELSIPSRRNGLLRSDPVRKFLKQRTDESKRQIIEFGGLVFDEANVTVSMPDGSHRTFFLEPREGGHAMTMAIEVDETDQMGATAEVLTRELVAALEAVAGDP